MQLNLFQQPQPDYDRLMITQQRVEQVDGLRLLDEYLDKNYETELIDHIDKSPWSNQLKRRVQHYGYLYDYKARRIAPETYLGPLPSWLHILAQKLQVDTLISFVPDQAIVNEYIPGQGIAPHIDCEPCFGDTIVSISLGSSCSIVFEKKREKERIEILLEPRCALVMQGEARYQWLHSIPARKVDNCDNQRLERQRRISITFRKVLL